MFIVTLDSLSIKWAARGLPLAIQVRAFFHQWILVLGLIRTLETIRPKREAAPPLLLETGACCRSIQHESSTECLLSGRGARLLMISGSCAPMLARATDGYRISTKCVCSLYLLHVLTASSHDSLVVLVRVSSLQQQRTRRVKSIVWRCMFQRWRGEDRYLHNN